MFIRPNNTENNVFINKTYENSSISRRDYSSDDICHGIFLIVFIGCIIYGCYVIKKNAKEYSNEERKKNIEIYLNNQKRQKFMCRPHFDRQIVENNLKKENKPSLFSCLV